MNVARVGGADHEAAEHEKEINEDEAVDDHGCMLQPGLRHDVQVKEANQQRAHSAPAVQRSEPQLQPSYDFVPKILGETREEGSIWGQASFNQPLGAEARCVLSVASPARSRAR